MLQVGRMSIFVTLVSCFNRDNDAVAVLVTSSIIERIVLLMKSSFAIHSIYGEIPIVSSSRYLSLLSHIVHVDGRSILLNAGSSALSCILYSSLLSPAAVIKTLTKWSACFTPAFFTRTEQFLALLAAPEAPTSGHALLYHVRLVELLAKCATFSANSEDKGEESQIINVLKSLVPIEHVNAVLDAPGLLSSRGLIIAD